MDCTRFEMLLVEHVTGDLPEAARTEIEAHLATCEACRALHATLAQGAKYAAVLPLEEPPKLDMTGLRAAMRARSAGAETAMNPEGPSGVLASGPAHEPSGPHKHAAAGGNDANPRPPFGEVFRKWVTGPQVAMATLTCLVLAIGLTYIPLAQRAMPADGDTVAAPESEPAAGAPTEQVGNAADVAPANAPAPSQIADSRFAASQGGDSTRRDEALDRFGFDDSPVEATNATPVPPVAAIVPPAPQPAMPQQAHAEVADGLANDEELSLNARRTGQSGEANAAPAAEAERAQTYAAQAPASRAPQTATTTTATPAAAAPPAPPQAQAAQGPSQQARGLDPGVTLAQARSLRSSGACGAATNVYQRFLSEAGPSHPQRGPAMLELADCLQRTGRTGVARQTLEQAQSVPSVAARARRELEQTTPDRQAAPARARPAQPRSSDSFDAADSAY